MPQTGSVAMVASSRKVPSSSHSTRSAISCRRVSWLTIAFLGDRQAPVDEDEHREHDQRGDGRSPLTVSLLQDV